jgi:hypothetical protein
MLVHTLWVLLGWITASGAFGFGWCVGIAVYKANAGQCIECAIRDAARAPMYTKVG